LAFIKDAQAIGDAFSPQKRTSSTSKHENVLLFLYLWVIFALLDLDLEGTGAGECDNINHPTGTVRYTTVFCDLMSALAMSNQRSFKIESFRFAAFVPKKIEYIRF
jgi:hypothetical protein